jgi:uncharacterized protein with GYD domain
MGLYLIEHSHSADACPTRNPEMVRQLRAHVAPENAERLGVSILGDWVSEPEHTVVFIVESDSEENIRNFAAPFQQMGQVKTRLGLTCEETAKACLGET